MRKPEAWANAVLEPIVVWRLQGVRGSRTIPKIMNIIGKRGIEKSSHNSLKTEPTFIKPWDCCWGCCWSRCLYCMYTVCTACVKKKRDNEVHPLSEDAGRNWLIRSFSCSTNASRQQAPIIYRFKAKSADSLHDAKKSILPHNNTCLPVRWN